MNTHQLRTGLRGNTVMTIGTEARALKAEAIAAKNEMIRLARVASSSLAKAGAAKHAGKAVVAQRFARDAYNQRVKAEGLKYAATYFEAASQSYHAALGDLLTATRTGDDKLIDSLVSRASLKMERGQAFARAVSSLSKRIASIPEPHVTSRRALEALISKAGGRSSEVSVHEALMVDRSKVPLLLVNFFPDEIVQASGALNGLGNVSQDAGVWWEEVQKALGVGVAAAAGAAQASGSEVSKGNPVLGVAFSATNGILNELSAKLNAALGINQRGATLPPVEEPSIPTPVVVGAIAVGGLILWGVFK